MSRPHDMPPGERWPHGVRARYVTGCRCSKCRAANTAYQRKRERLNALGQGNPIIDAGRIIDHLRQLQLLGVGTRAVAKSSGLHRTYVSLIRTGKKPRIRKRSAERLIVVTENARLGTIDATETWRNINTLIDMGWTKYAINRALGYKGSGLQLRRTTVTKKNARKVEQLLEHALQQQTAAQLWEAYYVYKAKTGTEPVFSMETIFSRYFKTKPLVYRWQR